MRETPAAEVLARRAAWAIDCSRSVFTTPGQIELTLMRWGASSNASDWAKPRIANFEAAYAACFTAPCFPLVDDSMTILPPRP